MGWFIALAVLLILIVAALIRSSWERRSPKIKEYEVESACLPEAFSGKRLVFLTDLHGQRFGEGNQELIRLIREARPDYLLVGGDMITVKPWSMPDFSALEELLSAFSGEVPMFYADGNHEERMASAADIYPGWKAEFDRLLSSYQLTYLSDERIRVNRSSSTLIPLAESSIRNSACRSLRRKRSRKRSGAQRGILSCSPIHRIILVHLPPGARTWYFPATTTAERSACRFLAAS